MVILTWLAMLAVVQNGLAQSTQTIRIYLNDQKLEDSDGANLARLIVATQPREKWWRVTVDKAQSVSSIVNKYFHIFGKEGSKGATPKTAQALTEAVRSANNLTSDIVPAGTTIDLPPVPVRAHSFCEEIDCAVREFDVDSKTYQRKSSIDSEPIEVASGIDANTMAGSKQWRKARITELVLQVDSTAWKKIREAKGRLLPANGIITTADGFDTLHLLSAPGPCETADQWLDTSPYKPLLLSLLSQLDKNALTAKASAFPFVVIDWDTAAPGHGSKVRSVVDFLLQQLSLHDSLKNSIETFDLNPSHSKNLLLKMLDDYSAYYTANENWGDLEASSVFAPAKKWIQKYQEPANVSQTQRVPSLVMQAVFYKYMMIRKAWVNLSFYVESSAFQTLENHYMTSSKSVGVFAAGDTGQELSPVMMPQFWASHWPTLMNVTYGSRDGTIWGDYSSARFDNYVTAVAPGCGYQSFNDKGSSFASPYVAVALWIQSLIKGPPDDLKSLAIVGSRLSPPLADGVESGGIFDPAFLLVAPGTHYIDRNGQYQSLKEMTLDLGVVTDGGTVNFHFTLPVSGPNRQTAIAPYNCGTEVCVWLRTWNYSRKRYDVAHDKLDSVKFSGITMKGNRLEASVRQDFRDLIQELYF